ncbi:sulfotransferase domain-containing protein [Candidatus Dojkabacteria bacterium]|uniref:Sulfotransferase domain-containing protein n=1 Tax=Candidatus Dojkabacteria bacterium TaxID=2099670 RepID=A0A955I6C2_9BACT|nr:sulfotransferase domain-containing protein [Candidatus Dojkabacteria bacterium]
MKPSQTFPDFLGIGAQKSATTWIDKMLRYHPMLYFPQTKEIHFFDQNFLNGLEWYSNHFMFAGNKVKGEITPAYAILPSDTIAFIRRLVPEVKLFFIMRNPVDRAWSHALMEFMMVRKLKYEEITKEMFLEHFNGEGSIIRGDYATNLTNWFKHFPRKRLLLCFYEDVEENPQQLLESIMNHLSVDPNLYPWDKLDIKKRFLVNKQIELPDDLKARLQEIYKDKVAALKGVIDSPRIDGWV